jgi:ABC-type multidrug transport system ATPase subunit
MLIIDNLTYYHKYKQGINGIHLQCNPGDITAIIGPNGAGKSTLVKCTVGLLNPQKGNVELNNISVLKKESKRNIGYLPEIIHISPQMTVNEVFELVCETKYHGKYLENCENLKRRLKIQNIGNKLIKECSMGMKKKLGIAVAFLGNPPLIVLDEPTNGVDTDGILTLKQLMKEAKDLGCSIIITSHVLDFIEKVSTSYIFLNKGTIEKCVKNDADTDLENIYNEIYHKNK